MTAEERGPARMTGASTTREDVERLAKRCAARWHDIDPDGESEVAATLRALLDERNALGQTMGALLDQHMTTITERDAARAEAERMREALASIVAETIRTRGDQSHRDACRFALRTARAALAGAPRHE